MRFFRAILIVICFLGFAPKSQGISFALDSIAQWGKFARFCVNTYYWGDRFFNTYDTTYVKGTGCKFNVKLTSQSWIDTYNLDFKPDGGMSMVSDVASNVGFHVSYLAVSVGYDMNINKFFNGYERSRKRINFAFNCALFSADFYVHNNDLTTTIKHFEVPGLIYKPHIKFDGMHTDRWGVDLYYFLNNKKYSQAAAFSYSRIQIKSNGSWYFGLSYCNQKYHFDFDQLPEPITSNLPVEFENYQYRSDTHTYALKVGYAYNWVPRRNWLVSVSESPVIGYRTGLVNNDPKKCCSVSNLLRFGAVYNLNKFFSGIQFSVYTNLTRDRETTLIANVFNAEINIGYRFNLW